MLSRVKILGENLRLGNSPAEWRLCRLLMENNTAAVSRHDAFDLLRINYTRSP